MLLQTLTAILPDNLAPWLAVIGFGAYHGLNPGMGWLFALSMGLQQRSERAIWVSFLPIAAGHAASIGVVALLIVAGAQLIPMNALQVVTSLLLTLLKLFHLPDAHFLVTKPQLSDILCHRLLRFTCK